MNKIRIAIALMVLISFCAACRSHDRCAAYNKVSSAESPETLTDK
jgi:hypothetical protein